MAQAKEGKKDLERKIVRVISPGTVVEEDFLEPAQSLSLLVIKVAMHLFSSCSNNGIQECAGTSRYGFCLLDCTIGEFTLGSFKDDTPRTTLETMLLRCSPKELICERVSSPASASS